MAYPEPLGERLYTETKVFLENHVRQLYKVSTHGVPPLICCLCRAALLLIPSSVLISVLCFLFRRKSLNQRRRFYLCTTGTGRSTAKELTTWTACTGEMLLFMSFYFLHLYWEEKRSYLRDFTLFVEMH